MYDAQLKYKRHTDQRYEPYYILFDPPVVTGKNKVYDKGSREQRPGPDWYSGYHVKPYCRAQDLGKCR